MKPKLNTDIHSPLSRLEQLEALTPEGEEPPHLLMRNLSEALKGCDNIAIILVLVLGADLDEHNIVAVHKDFFTNQVRPHMRLSYPRYKKVIKQLKASKLVTADYGDYIRINPTYLHTSWYKGEI